MIKASYFSIGNLKNLCFMVFAVLLCANMQAQTIYTLGDFISNNTDGQELYSESETVTNCTSISFSLDWSSSFTPNTWAGSGNMESIADCGSCAGDINDSSAGDCEACWDFFLYEFYFDGNLELDGFFGTTDLNDGDNFTWESPCLDPTEDYDFQVDAISQTWAADETFFLENIMVICHNPVIEPEVILDPGSELCEGEDLGLELTGNYTDAEWYLDGANVASGLTTTINGVTAADAGTYTVEASDVNGCISTEDFIVDILPIPDVCPVTTPIEPCSNLASGEAEIDLSVYDSEANCFTSDDVLWFSDLGDIPDFPIIDPTSFQTFGGSVYAVVFNGICYSDPEAVFIDVAAGLEPEIDIDNATICEGQNLLFDVMNIPSCGNCDFDWEGPPTSGITETTTSSLYSVLNANADSSGDWTVTVTDENGCTGSSAIAVIVTSGPTGTISGGGALCPGYCTDAGNALTLDLSGGTAPYDATLEISIGFLNVPLTLPAFLPNGSISLCIDPAAFLPSLSDFDGDGVDDIVIPNIALGFSIELMGLEDTNGCTGMGSGVITYTIEPEPDADDPGGPYELCEGMLFDLTSFDNTINAAETVSWYEDMDLTMPIGNPMAYDPASSPLTVWAVVDNGTCLSLPVSLELIEIEAPMLDPIADETSCGQFEFILPSGTDLGANVFYEDAAGNQFFAGDITSTPGTYTAFAGDNPDCIAMVDFALAILEQPSIISPATDLFDCGEITLPTIDVLDLDPADGVVSYSTGADQTGTIFSEGDAILEADGITTLFVFASNGPNCFEEITIDLNFTSDIEYILPSYPDEACGELELLAIGGSTPDVAYYTEMNGAGDEYQIGDFLPAPGTYTLYVYDLFIDQTCVLNSNESFTITLGVEPEIISPDTELSGCGEIILPFIDVVDLDPADGFVLYAEGANQTGMTYDEGDGILESDGITELYVYASNGPDCFDELVIDLTFTSEIEYILPDYPEEACGDFLLLPIGGATSGVAYFTEEDGGGIAYFAGDVLEGPGSFTLYAFDPDIDQICVLNANESFTITLELEPIVDPIADVEVCETTGYILQDITGDFLTGNEGYATMTGGGGQTFEPGDLIDVSTTIYVYDNSGACPATEVIFNVNVIPAPNAGDDNTISSCEGPQIDLSTILSSDADAGGVFESGTATIIGANMDQWNSAGQPLDTPIFFNYIVESTNTLCPPDTAVIIISLSNDVSAGVAIMDSIVCEGELIDLFGLIEGESAGGYFIDALDPLVQNFDGEWLATGTSANFVFVIDPMGACNGDQTDIAVGVTDTQTITIDVTDFDLCSGQCTDLIFDATANFNFSMLVFDIIEGESFDFDLEVDGMQVIQVCMDGTLGDFDGETLSLGEASSGYFFEFVNEDFDEQCFPATIDLDDFTIETQAASIVTVMGQICDGEAFEYNGEFYTQTQELTSFSLNGCDSTTFIIVEEFSASENFETDTYCNGTMVEIAGNIYTEDTNIQLLLEDGSVNGCDSIIYVDIKFDNASYNTIEQTICPESSEMVGGIIYDFDNPMGADTLINGSVLGCDSIITVMLDFYPAAMGEEMMTICQGDTINILGEDFYEGMEMMDVSIGGASANGCDSIVTVMIDFFMEPSGTETQMICQGDTINILGVDFYAGMESMDITLMGEAANGCDSIVSVSIEFLAAMEIDTVFEKCEGVVLDIDGFMITDNNLNGFFVLEATGSGTDCATVVNYTTNLLPATNAIIDTTICQGETIMINGIEFSEAYTFDEMTTIGANGCDNTTTINVNIDGGETAINQESVGNNMFQLMYQSTSVVDVVDPIWSSSASGLSCEECETTTITITEDIEIYLTAFTIAGCRVADTLFLSYIPEEVFVDIYYPTIFTPDDPSFNNVYTIFGTSGIQIDEFTIYDRWGNVVHRANDFMTNDASASWNGRIQGDKAVEGVYVGIIKYRDYLDVEQFEAFDLTLVR